MQRSDIKVLIVEDDSTLGKALEAGLKRAGYGVQLVQNLNQALGATKLHEFHGLVVDCMLPGKNGIDTAIALQKELPENVVTVLMSGIYKDRSYSLDAQTRTKARAFLNKPFDLQELIKEFDSAFSEILDQNSSPLLNSLFKSNRSPKEVAEAINSTQYIHGFDLPLVYNLLIDCKLSGELHIYYDEQKESIVNFNNGSIDGVKHTDSESYFGVLLIEKGYVSNDDLQASLKLKDNKRIGERLVDSSTLSPHAIDVINYEQMVIRLSKTISDMSVKVNFQETTPKDTSTRIESHTVVHLTSDWICSKLTTEWLRSFYNQWSHHPVGPGPNYTKASQLKDLPAAQGVIDFVIKKDFNRFNADLDNTSIRNDEEFLRGVHFFLLQKVIAFEQKENTLENFDNKIARFKKIFSGFTGQNYFEILGVGKNARSQEINRCYHELAKSLHPDKLSPSSPPELIELAKTVFSKITDAYQTLSNPTKKENYLKTLEVGFAEEILKSEAIFDEGLRFLKSNQFRDARKAFQKSMKLKGHRSDTVIYVAWAYAKEKRRKMESDKLSLEIKSMLDQVAHEDRHSIPYFFTKAMYYELSGQIEKAYANFKHCVKLDPDFIDAKREIAFLKQNFGSKKSNIFTDDISTVVTKLFKKNAG